MTVPASCTRMPGAKWLLPRMGHRMKGELVSANTVWICLVPDCLPGQTSWDLNTRRLMREGVCLMSGCPPSGTERGLGSTDWDLNPRTLMREGEGESEL